ncbi:SDR family NAD(P)-dependent oxidoreductase [Nocardia brasiliensis]|uniref:SDR family NAD(P)-dependent oxidoreductase n=1 Tax=Nocardia brasiliensis TaxID=37326 RepID=UPI003D8AF858
MNEELVAVKADRVDFGLHDARVLVVGAGGLGGACVEGFVRAGARVFVTDKDERRLRNLDARLGLTATGGGVSRRDLDSSAECDAVVGAAVDALGGVDVFLHAIGVNPRRPVLESSDADWDAVISVNLSTAYWLGRAVGRIMCKAEYGRIVFLSSVSGALAHPRHGPYAASKGGLNQLLRVMAVEWAEHRVTVNAVAPGYVPTALTNEHLAEPGVYEQLRALVPAGRLAEAEEIVGPALFLASEWASFVTGQVLYVDGGRSLV